MGANRIALHWDEAEYLNSALIDHNHKHAQGYAGLWKSLLHTNEWRPPAHRILVLPVTLVMRFNLLALRLAGIAEFLLALWFIRRAVALISGGAAGFFAAMCLGCCAGSTLAIRTFGTESGTYLTIAACIYFIFKAHTHSRQSWFIAIGLGLFMGLGLLAKLSFPWVLCPMLVVCLVLSALGHLPGLRLGQLIASIGIGGVVALPWYWFNFRNYLWLAGVSQHYVRVASGNLSVAVIKAWAMDLVAEGFGFPLAILFAAVLVVAIAMIAIGLGRSSEVSTRLPQRIKVPLFLCLAGMIPLPLVQLLFSTNHVIRIMTPALIPAMVALGLIVGATPLLRWRLVTFFVGAMMIWQIKTVLAPMSREVVNLWDLHPVYDMARRHRLHDPAVYFLGNNPTYNIASVATPFLEKGETPQTHWFWDYTLPLDWNEIHKWAGWADIVLVPAEYDGKDWTVDRYDLDNAHNAEFDRWLRESGSFDGPERFFVDRNHSVTLNVYFRRRQITARASGQ